MPESGGAGPVSVGAGEVPPDESALGGNPLPLLLRLTALVSVVWAAGLIWWADTAAGGLRGAEQSVANGLALTHLVLAFVFWRAARDPMRERTGVYAAIAFLGLRLAKATWEVLWVLEGPAAVVALLELIASTALFVGVINALPSGLASPPSRRA